VIGSVSLCRRGDARFTFPLSKNEGTTSPQEINLQEVGRLRWTALNLLEAQDFRFRAALKGHFSMIASKGHG
jgi:hypothetical protein